MGARYLCAVGHVPGAVAFNDRRELVAHASILALENGLPARPRPGRPSRHLTTPHTTQPSRRVPPRTPSCRRPSLPHHPRIHLKRTHQWAGEFRTVNISKGGQLFGVAAFIALALQEVLRKLPEEGQLKPLDARNFATRAGYYLARFTQSILSGMGMVAPSASSSANWRSKRHSSSIGTESPANR
jgi:hypothetical protein